MIGDAHALEHAEPLVAEWPSGDAIDVQNARMRGQARQDGRVRMPLGPLEDPRQASPVRLVLEIRRPRFGAGDDETVVMAAFHSRDVE
jgi:hypothetical protein